MILVFVEWQHVPVRYRTMGKHDSCLCRVAACSSQISFEGKHDSCLCRVAACSSQISVEHSRGNMILVFVEWQHVPARYRFEGKHDSCRRVARIMFQSDIVRGET